MSNTSGVERDGLSPSPFYFQPEASFSNDTDYYVWSPEMFYWYWMHVYLPFTWLAWFSLLTSTVCLLIAKVYDKMPGSLMRYIIFISLGWQSLMILKWTPGSIHTSLVLEPSVAACKFTAAADNFGEFGNVVMYTFVMIALWAYSVQEIEPKPIHNRIMLVVFFVLILPCTISPIFVEVSTTVGWCVVSNKSIWFTKITPWLLLLAVQLLFFALILIAQFGLRKNDTNFQYEENETDQLIRRTQTKLIMMLFIQIIGWFPVMVMETYSVRDKQPPAVILGIIGVCTPFSDVLASIIVMSNPKILDLLKGKCLKLSPLM